MVIGCSGHSCPAVSPPSSSRLPGCFPPRYLLPQWKPHSCCIGGPFVVFPGQSSWRMLTQCVLLILGTSSSQCVSNKPSTYVLLQPSWKIYSCRDSIVNSTCYCNLVPYELAGTYISFSVYRT